MKNSQKILLDPQISWEIRKYLSYIWKDISGDHADFICAGGFPRYLGLIQLALDGDQRAQSLFDDWDLLQSSIEKCQTLREVSKEIMFTGCDEIFEIYCSGSGRGGNKEFLDFPFFFARFFIAPYVRGEALNQQPQTIDEKNRAALTGKGKKESSERDIDIFIRNDRSLLDFVLRLGKQSVHSWLNTNRPETSGVSAIFKSKMPISMISSSSSFLTDCSVVSTDENENENKSSNNDVIKESSWWDYLIEQCQNFLPFESEIPEMLKKSNQYDKNYIIHNFMRGIRSDKDLELRERMINWVFFERSYISKHTSIECLFSDISVSQEDNDLDHDNVLPNIFFSVFKEIYIPCLEGKMSLEEAEYHLEYIEGEYLFSNFPYIHNTKYTKYSTSVYPNILSVKKLSTYLRSLYEGLGKTPSIDVRKYIMRLDKNASILSAKESSDDLSYLSSGVSFSGDLYDSWVRCCVRNTKIPRIQFVTGEDLLFGEEDLLFENFDIANCAWKLHIGDDGSVSIEASRDAINADLERYFKVNHGRSLFTSRRLKKYSERERPKKVMFSDDALRDWCNNLFFSSFEKENTKGVFYGKSKIIEIASFWDVPDEISAMFVGSFDVHLIEETDNKDEMYGSLKQANKTISFKKSHDWAMTYMAMQNQKGKIND